MKMIVDNDDDDNGNNIWRLLR